MSESKPEGNPQGTDKPEWAIELEKTVQGLGSLVEGLMPTPERSDRQVLDSIETALKSFSDTLATAISGKGSPPEGTPPPPPKPGGATKEGETKQTAPKKRGWMA